MVNRIAREREGLWSQPASVRLTAQERGDLELLVFRQVALLRRGAAGQIKLARRTLGRRTRSRRAHGRSLGRTRSLRLLDRRLARSFGLTRSGSLLLRLLGLRMVRRRLELILVVLATAEAGRDPPKKAHRTLLFRVMLLLDRAGMSTHLTLRDRRELLDGRHARRLGGSRFRRRRNIRLDLGGLGHRS